MTLPIPMPWTSWDWIWHEVSLLSHRPAMIPQGSIILSPCSSDQRIPFKGTLADAYTLASESKGGDWPIKHTHQGRNELIRKSYGGWMLEKSKHNFLSQEEDIIAPVAPAFDNGICDWHSSDGSRRHPALKVSSWIPRDHSRRKRQCGWVWSVSLSVRKNGVEFSF